MPRFLSTEWFALAVVAPDDPPAERPLVIKQVVRGGPDGDISYLVVIESGSARIERSSDDGEPADLTISTSWSTASAIAAGTLSSQRALMEGRLRVSGNLNRLLADRIDLSELDPLPPGVRQQTTY